MTVTMKRLKENLDSMVSAAINYEEEIVVATNEGNAVIISESEYNSLKETIYLLSHRGMLERIKEGEKESIDAMKTYDKKEPW